MPVEAQQRARHALSKSLCRALAWETPRLRIDTGGSWQGALTTARCARQGSKSKKPCGTGPALFFAHHLISLIRASDEWAAVVKEECGEQAADDDARAMDKLSNLRIGLVPAAIGGTAIDAWVENAPLYEHLLKQTHRALSASTPAPPTSAGAPAAAAPASSGGPATLSASSEGESRPKLAAVLWHQVSGLGFRGSSFGFRV